jgi:hypothetical protein
MYRTCFLNATQVRDLFVLEVLDVTPQFGYGFDGASDILAVDEARDADSQLPAR